MKEQADHSMPDTRTVHASCLCEGAQFDVQVDATALPLPIDLCHCSSCLHANGTLCDFSFDILGPPTEHELGKLVGYDSSESLRRFFCGKCGTRMLMYSKPNNHWSMATGAIAAGEDAASLFAPGEHNYVKDTRDGGLSDWLVTGMDGQKLARWAGGQTDDYETDEKKKSQGHGEGDGDRERLHAYCHCRGVELYIHRPDEARGEDGAMLPAHDPDLQPVIRDNGRKWVAESCVCNLCRKAAGQDIFSFVFLAKSHITLRDGRTPYTPVCSDTVREYQSSAGVTRTFCGRCGAKIAFHMLDRPKRADLAIGLLDAASGARAEDWLVWSDKVGFVDDARDRKWVSSTFRDGYLAWQAQQQQQQQQQQAK